tara:strand:+ start:26414 stop:27418 length:1005 start_codon:yes stop_codon:yes gene_type:complete
VKKLKKINIGISTGDPNGIGIEVILKALSNTNLQEQCNFIIYSSLELIEHQREILKINTLPINQTSTLKNLVSGSIYVKEIFSSPKFEFGTDDRDISKYGIISFKSSLKDAIENKIDVLVTSPINKSLSYSTNFKFSGHTDYLKDFFKIDPLMLMISDKLRVGLLTDHIPLKDILNNLSTSKVIQKLNTLINCLVKDLGVKTPKIAVLAINPHVGDNGIIGNEDQKILIPAITKINSDKKLVHGPFSADTFFSNNNFANYDAVVAAYHDQGLIPFKTLTFGNGVNYSAGLPIIRTSPDHGTAFDIAGKGIADPSSFLQALKLGVDIFKSRNKLV